MPVASFNLDIWIHLCVTFPKVYNARCAAGPDKTTTGTSPTKRPKQALRAAASVVARDDAAAPAVPPAEVQVTEDGDLEQTRTTSKRGPRERAAASRVSPWRANTEQDKR